ncbi:MAG TPA: acyl-ACP--UDP-N-acetylglucosamine O-acyltransferase [Alphaproteobacteria bacterium]
MTTHIHSTAVIHDGARIGANVQIGPYCVIGPKVIIGDRTILHSHVVIDGNTTIGTDNEIFPFASLGHKPQDLKFKGEDSRLVIGDRNVIREYVTMNPGTADDRMETTVGSDGLFMMSVHIAHDCVVGDRVIMANAATIAGHVVVGDGARLGGLCAVRQKIRIGKNAMIGGMTGVESDVIPYGMIVGERGSLAGLNLVGLERSGVEKTEINNLRHLFKNVFESDEATIAQRIEKAANDYSGSEFVTEIIDFVRNKGPYGICMPKSNHG